jgi:antitoxin component of RelBE/YafQ-DinJ toxin-antitoxin module
VKAYEKSHERANTAEVLAGIRPIVNALLNDIAKTGTLPGELAKEEREANAWAISELLQLLPQLDNWKRMSILNEMKNAIQPMRIEATKKMEGAA